jgi:transcriptional regulator with XRE-family HTH domain
MAAEDGARRYGPAMSEAFKACAAMGVTQKQLAAEIHSSPSVVSRYLNGLRIAPADFLDSFCRFLQDHGCGLDEDAHRKLHDLRREALRTSTAASNRIAYLEELTTGLRERIDELLRTLQNERDEHTLQVRRESEEAGRLQGLLAEAARERDLLVERVEEFRLAAQDTDRLERQLADAEQNNRLLQDSLGEKDRQLKHAGDYIRTVETDWERISAKATALAVLSCEVGDAAGGWLACERGVSAVVIVGVEPGGVGVSAFLFGAVGPGVGPLVEQGEVPPLIWTA